MVSLFKPYTLRDDTAVGIFYTANADVNKNVKVVLHNSKLRQQGKSLKTKEVLLFSFFSGP